jgi:excisionase family DNA binding protein
MNDTSANSDENNNQLFLTVRDLCQRWRISRETIQRHIKDKKIPHLKLFGGLRFRLADIKGFESALEAQK